MTLDIASCLIYNITGSLLWFAMAERPVVLILDNALTRDPSLNSSVNILATVTYIYRPISGCTLLETDSTAFRLIHLLMQRSPHFCPLEINNLMAQKTRGSSEAALN